METLFNSQIVYRILKRENPVLCSKLVAQYVQVHAADEDSCSRVRVRVRVRVGARGVAGWVSENENSRTHILRDCNN